MAQTAMREEAMQAGWRFCVGVCFFALGLVSPVFISLVNGTNLPAQRKTVRALFIYEAKARIIEA